MPLVQISIANGLTLLTGQCALNSLRCWLLSENNLSAWTSHTCPYPYQQNASRSTAHSAVPYHVSLWFPEFFHLPTAPRACTILWAQLEWQGDRNNSGSPPAGGGRDAGKGRMHELRKILRHLGCHALGQDLALCAVKRHHRPLEAEDTVRTYGQNVSGLRERQAGTERETGRRRGMGCYRNARQRHDTGQQREELEEVNWQTR